MGWSNRYYILISHANYAYIFSLIICDFCITLSATKNPVGICLARKTSLYFPSPNFLIIIKFLYFSSNFCLSGELVIYVYYYNLIYKWKLLIFLYLV